jgi:hypothetical protein
MRQRTAFSRVLGLLTVMIVSLAIPAKAAPAERYLHVNVQNPAEGQSVNVNVPLSLAENILPAINNGQLHNGKISIDKANMNGVDLQAILEAVRTAPDNQFVTVKDKNANVRVSKSGGKIVVHVTDTKDKEQNVDVMVPLTIVNALFATAKNNELDVSAALRALRDAGDVVLVTVQNSGARRSASGWIREIRRTERTA